MSFTVSPPAMVLLQARALSETTATTPEPDAAGSVPQILSVQAADLNWFSIFALLFVAAGLFALASAIVGASAWYGSDPERRRWAGRHLAYGTIFATLLALIGLGLAAMSLFTTLSWGGEAAAILTSLPGLLIVYLFAADSFCEGRSAPVGVDAFDADQTRKHAQTGAPPAPAVAHRLAAPSDHKRLAPPPHADPDPRADPDAAVMGTS